MGSLVATLKRLDFTDAGTFGKIEYPGGKMVTGELPYRANLPNQSCIPPGEYQCVWSFSPRFQMHTYLIKNVPGREAIRFHPGNWCGDRDMGFRSNTDGCVLLGREIRHVDKLPFLFDSASAVREFGNVMKHEPFVLMIAGPRML